MKIDKTGIEERFNARGEVVAYEVRAQVGAGKDALKDRQRFPAGASWIEMASWRLSAIKALEKQRGGGAGSFDADVARYLREAPITPANRTRRKQQLAFWAAQPAALDAPVLTVADVLAGRRVPDATTIGESKRRDLTARRVRQVLAAAFAPTDPTNDPTEFAGTSNHYRIALYHLYTVLDMDAEDATNPIDKVAPRMPPAPARVGQDMRIVARILEAMSERRQRLASLTEKRAAVLAWCPITPVQLQRLSATDFRDVPNATRDEMIAGAIAVELKPRLKGRRKRIPPPSLEPLTPRGVEALRALVATPDAFVPWSTAALNKAFKIARDRTAAALAAEAIAVDLSKMTLYVLKHSLTATMSLASGGRVDARTGEIVIPDGVRQMLGHGDAKTTRIYALGAVDPIKAEVSAATARYLDVLFTHPLGAPPAAPVVEAPAVPRLRRVK